MDAQYPDDRKQQVERSVNRLALTLSIVSLALALTVGLLIGLLLGSDRTIVESRHDPVEVCVVVANPTPPIQGTGWLNPDFGPLGQRC